MTITLPLKPQEEAILIAMAEAKGQTVDDLIRDVLDPILAERQPDADHRCERNEHHASASGRHGDDGY